MKLADYLSALLQEFTRGKAQADRYARELARDLTNEEGFGTLPVSLYGVDEARVTTRVAVLEVSPRYSGTSDSYTMVNVAAKLARDFPDMGALSDLFEHGKEAEALWCDEYVPRITRGLKRGVQKGTTTEVAASLFASVSVNQYVQYLFDPDLDISGQRREEFIRGPQIRKLRRKARQIFQRRVRSEGNDRSDRGRGGSNPAQVDVLVSTDELATVDKDLLTEIEIRITGQQVRWEIINGDNGELRPI